MLKARKKEKTLFAWELGAGSDKEKELIRLGAIVPYPNGQYALMSQEAYAGGGQGQMAMRGDYFKVDHVNGMQFPYPNARDKFLKKHKHVKGNKWCQPASSPMCIYRAGDKPNKAVKWLLDSGRMTLNPNDPQHYFNAVLWGSPLSAPQNATVIFYGIDTNPDGSIRDIDFNFIVKEMFDRDYEILK